MLLLLIFFFQPFKNVTPFLAPRPYTNKWFGPKWWAPFGPQALVRLSALYDSTPVPPVMSFFLLIYELLFILQCPTQVPGSLGYMPIPVRCDRMLFICAPE